MWDTKVNNHDETLCDAFISDTSYFSKFWNRESWIWTFNSFSIMNDFHCVRTHYTFMLKNVWKIPCCGVFTVYQQKMSLLWVFVSIVVCGLLKFWNLQKNKVGFESFDIIYKMNQRTELTFYLVNLRGGGTLFMRGKFFSAHKKRAPPLLNWPNKRL